MHTEQQREPIRLEDLGYPSLEGHDESFFGVETHIGSVAQDVRESAMTTLSLDTEQEVLGVSPEFYESLDRDHRILLSALIRIGRRVTDYELAAMLFNEDSPSTEQVTYASIKMLTLTTRASYFKQGYTMPQLLKPGSRTLTYFWRYGKGGND